jgi:hypothetical protein
MQHGGRDNDWRHRAWTMPETIARMCDADDAREAARRISLGMTGGSDTAADLEYPTTLNGLEPCVVNWNAVERVVAAYGGGSVRATIEDYLAHGKELYAAFVDAGIPWQDARRLLWMGTQTYIHCDYNYVALKGVLGNRLEHVMDWEVNCVAQLMMREVRMKCPPMFGRYLGSHSDFAKRAMFAGLESWPADGKYPNPYETCALCKHPREQHEEEARTGVYVSAPHAPHAYVPTDRLPRQHRAQQMPFWVLTPAAMDGGPIDWIPTNGVYPHETIARLAETT